MKKMIAIIMAVCMAFSIVGTAFADDDNSTLVVGYADFSQKFSPFFAKTAYDQDVADMTQAYVTYGDREGTPIQTGIEGQVIPYNGTDYTYYTIANVTDTANADGTVDYEIKLRNDIKFSDGEPMTIDDLIFTMYVMSDPAYDGSSTFNQLPIEGMEEYRAGMNFLYSLILAAGEDNKEFTFWTADQQAEYWAAIKEAGAAFIQEIVDYCAASGYGKTVAEAAATWGYELEANAEVIDFWNRLVDEYGYDFSDDGINYETAGSDIKDLINGILGDDAAAFNGMITTGDSASSIKGLTRVDDYTLKVHCTTLDATAIYNFELPVAPLHYYGDKAKYDFAKDQFGFDKGDLTGVKSKTTQPLGAGPYKFVSYENGVVTFEANENYFKGEPKIKNILFQEANDSDKVPGVVAGTFDITDPSFNNTAVSAIKSANGGELTGKVITTNTVDNLGYGYIGICAYNVKVGSDSASDASKALRKAFATLFAVHRETAVNSYYGDRASVIQYPISNTSWAAPKPNDEGYQLAYSVDVNGKSIYTDGMSEEQKYEAALEAATGFFKAAGFTWDDATSKFTAAPEGARMTYEVIIPADGIGDHPAYGILTATKEALAKIGITLEINDPSDSNVLWNAIEAVPSTADMWAAAWQSSVDPDMKQVYYSTNINGAGGTDSNHYYVTDPKLDKLIDDGRSSTDMSFRKATYKEALETIIDWAVEIPTYQRQNAVIFSTERVNMSTVTPDITTFWGWMHDLELLELN